MILAYYGDISNIPTGFKLCDGTNGTPNLCGRTIIGVGAWADAYGSTIYSIGNTGGEREHQLTIAEMPAHQHGTVGGDDGYPYSNPWGTYDFSGKYLGHSGGTDLNNPSPFSSVTGGNQPHNIMQPYIALYYIIKA